MGQPFEHRIRCRGGPLDGRGYLVDSEHQAPPRIVDVTGPDGAVHKYLRVMPLTPMRPGDPWEYVPLPPQNDGSGPSPIPG